MSRLFCIVLVSVGVMAQATSPLGAPAVPNDARTVEHVLNRLSYGPRPGEIGRVQHMGLGRWIAQQLEPARLDNTVLDRRLAMFETLALDAGRIVRDYYQPAIEERRSRQREAASPADPSMTTLPAPGAPVSDAQQKSRRIVADLEEAKIVRAVYSELQLEEVLVDFWFNHFNVFAGKGQTRAFVTSFERDAIRPHVLGSFRQMLEAVATDPAMLFYLDNWRNTDPNAEPRAQRRPPSTPGPQKTQTTQRPPNTTGPQNTQRPPNATEPQKAQITQNPRSTPGPQNAQSPPTATEPQKTQRPQNTTGPQITQSAQSTPEERTAPAPLPARGGLNENYARELLELHTLGVDGGYTQADIVNVARAFTGWTFRPRDGSGFTFAARQHDKGEKVVLGHVIKAGGGVEDGRRVLDILAAHPATARFIAAKLVQKFVSDVPPKALVDRAARRFLETRGNLREVMRVIALSPELFDAEAYRAKVKTPLEFVASALRATGADVQSALPLARALRDLGMPPYFCQPPTGYAETGDTWTSPGALVARMNFALMLGSNRLRGVSVPFEPGTSDAALRDRIVAQVLPGTVSDATRGTVAKASTVQQVLALTIGSPEFQRQ